MVTIAQFLVGDDREYACGDDEADDNNDGRNDDDDNDDDDDLRYEADDNILAFMMPLTRFVS